MSSFSYRLQPLLDQKIDLKEQAQTALADKQKQHRLACEKLEELRASAEAISIKRQTLRRSLLLSGTGEALNGVEIARRREHLKSVSAELEAAKDAVFAQQLFIDECKERVVLAQRHLAECSREVEILNKHREKLELRFRREAARREALEIDEIGNMLYSGKGQNL
jgi:flagellar biosynthesis chaperone FliJ